MLSYELVEIQLEVQFLVSGASDVAVRAKVMCNRTGNRSPKGNIWSAIPVALLCMILKLSQR